MLQLRLTCREDLKKKKGYILCFFFFLCVFFLVFQSEDSESTSNHAWLLYINKGTQVEEMAESK